jgi:hypothetical protein
MNFVEALEFMRAVKAFRCKNSKELPKMQLYDFVKEGYVVYVKMDSVNKEFSKFLKKAVETRGLILSKTNGFLAVRSLCSIIQLGE